jgi:hypothetical protein
MIVNENNDVLLTRLMKWYFYSWYSIILLLLVDLLECITMVFCRCLCMKRCISAIRAYKKTRKLNFFFNLFSSLNSQICITNVMPIKFKKVFGRVVKVVDCKPLAPHRCWFESRQGLWILSCKEAISSHSSFRKYCYVLPGYKNCISKYRRKNTIVRLVRQNQFW